MASLEILEQNVTNYFLGADVGSTKTHVLVADAAGQIVGFGEAGAGNHEGVGYDGLAKALQTAAGNALRSAGLAKEQISAAGFGVAGLDWPSEKEDTLQAIHTLGLSCPVDAVNDTLIGLVAGSELGWGIGIVSGTGCNCRGWDKTHQREGMVTGASLMMGEAAGATEVVKRALVAVAHEWMRRGPATRLSAAFVEHAGAHDLPDLLEGLVNERYKLRASAAPIVFDVAKAGDAVALEVIQWAGNELGELGKAVIRQLEIQDQEFDVVMIGSMFNGGPLLIEPMQANILAFSPGVRFTRLSAPPAVGGVLLAMDLVGARTPVARQRLIDSFLT